jgi:hypothetical protein
LSEGGKIKRHRTNAFHSSSSIVGSGVALFAWCSYPLYVPPRYANFRAMGRVVYLLGLKARGALGGLVALLALLAAAAAAAEEEGDNGSGS